MQCEVATFTPYKNLTETRENNLQSRPQAKICTGSSNWKKRSNARTGLQRYDHVIQSLPRILNRRNNVRVDGVDKVSAALHCTHIRKSFAAVLNECIISVHVVTAAQITRQVKPAVLLHPVCCITTVHFTPNCNQQVQNHSPPTGLWKQHHHSLTLIVRDWNFFLMMRNVNF